MRKEKKLAKERKRFLVASGCLSMRFDPNVSMYLYFRLAEGNHNERILCACVFASHFHAKKLT